MSSERTKDDIVATTSLRDYFDEAIRDALKNQQLNPEEATCVYVVDLLVEYALCQAAPSNQPLGMRLARSEQAGPARRASELKQVGDEALYTAGFFNESLTRRDLDVGYYSRIGGTAYRRLSDLLSPRDPGAQFASVYAELSELFREFTGVLVDVRSAGVEPAEDLGAAYELWARTGSATAERQLRDAGVMHLFGTAGDTTAAN